MKPSDEHCISLCMVCHAYQHQIGEPAFEKRHGIDMKALAVEFKTASPFWRKARRAA